MPSRNKQPGDPQAATMKAVLKLLDQNKLLDPAKRYSVCLCVAGLIVARDLAGDPSPAILAAPGIIANAMEEALRLNPGLGHAKALAAMDAASEAKN